MKNLTTNMMIAAAALMVAAGVAEAQQLKAEIPFSFRANGAVMPAGEYRVDGTITPAGAKIFRLRNVDENRSVLAVPYVANNGPDGGAATLTFKCHGDQCVLDQVAPGTGHAYVFRNPNWGKNEDTRVAVIRAVLVK